MFVQTGLSGLGARLSLTENEAAALTMAATSPAPASFVRPVPAVGPSYTDVVQAGGGGINPPVYRQRQEAAKQEAAKGTSAAPLLLSALAFLLFRGNA